MTLLYFVIRENAFDITHAERISTADSGGHRPQTLTGDSAPLGGRSAPRPPLRPPPPSTNFCIGHGQSMTVFVGDYLLSVYNDDPTPRLRQ